MESKILYQRPPRRRQTKAEAVAARYYAGDRKVTAADYKKAVAKICEK